ncbi:MAG TPA: pyruvate dehydrogenase (acetyl-transferring), homodimeric type, partial [Gammaproteobacteria bacterium]|nr:pyruvate dehydrogenase (acetyl-transferring), homodimeric type [Gammaproteobacteria bacterium]
PRAKVWALLGDGEMDEPEALGAISLAAREKLDNLIFVVNCNLQRLDGPVRGNGKIIQELEADFRGNNWNVIKVLWGSRWDPLLERDTKGLLRRVMEECVDGEYQTFKSRDGGYVRDHFFGRYPELKEMVANMSDEEIWYLNRGGNDSRKVYAAYEAANKHKGQPSVILAKTVKGFGLGKAMEGLMGAHQQKKLDEEALRAFRDRWNIPVDDKDLNDLPLVKPAKDSKEMKYLHARRKALQGYLPQRNEESPKLKIPELSAFKSQLEGTDREVSTTMALVRMIATLLKDKNIGERIVPIIPDEARTFGMEGMFRQIGIYSSKGQLYEPQDADKLMVYKESKDGQILEEGITEAGAVSSWIAAATSYSTNGLPMIPFYMFYSMFGFQRIGDFTWAAGDMCARGFLIGGTAGRTTINGEGLQHEDGHSHILSSVVPNCRSYDPTFAYEMAVIVHDGMQRMYVDQENVYYYITAMNENYAHPAMPKDAEEGIIRGMYSFSKGTRSDDNKKKKQHVQLMGSGTILREVIAATKLLDEEWNVTADVWACPSFTELRRDGLDTARWNRLHPGKKAKNCWVEQQLKETDGPFVAATDYMKAYADQIREWIPGQFITLGTDGFGRSDSRAQLRHHFEVDRYWITQAALKALADEGKIDPKLPNEAMKKYKLDAEKPNPVTV